MTSSDFIKTYRSSPHPVSGLKPFIIAEAGVNHEGSMETARMLIELAAEGGANAVKFQSYKAHTLASKHSPAYWDMSREPTKSQYELFKKYDAFWKDEFEELKLHCDANGIEFMSTPFDAESATFLNDLINTFKISSSDITNKPFIEQITSFGKPVILSTGASSKAEIEEAIGWVQVSGTDICVMHCILNYPTPDEMANLGMIADIRRTWPQLLTGYSDHTMPGDMSNLVTAFLLGAQMIEKHFTHDKSLPGNDHYHAMDIDDLRRLHDRLDVAIEILGQSEKDYIPSEEISRRNARRSLVAARDIPSGKHVEADDLTWKRPASGISPKDIESVIGKEAVLNIAEDTVIQWSMFTQDPV